MAALNFPSSPSNGQTYTANNVTYVWNGTAWKKNIPSQSPVSGINTVGGVVGIANHLDVDGHTNLDNVSIAGVTTTGTLTIDVNGTDDGDTTLLTLDNYIADIGTEYSWIDFTFRDTNANATPQVKIGAQAQDPTGNQTQEGTADFVVQCGVDGNTSSNTMTEMFRCSHEGKITSVHHNPASDSDYDLGTNTVRWRNVYADTLYGDGSNLTGTSVVKQIREAASTGESGTGQSYTDKVTLTMTVQNNSRVLIISSYELQSSTPFGSGNNTMAKTIKVGGSFVGEEVVNAHNGYYSYSGSKKYDIFYDTDNGAGSRSYKIQWKRNTSGTGYIKNARLLGIELGIGP